MSVRRTKGAEEGGRARPGRANRESLRRAGEAEIAATSPPELADLPADFWDSATLVVPEAKEPISLRVDRDVLTWFRSQGPGYQTRMNAVLRSFMEARRRG